jgi:hypothetical protein
MDVPFVAAESRGSGVLVVVVVVVVVVVGFPVGVAGVGSGVGWTGTIRTTPARPPRRHVVAMHWAATRAWRLWVLSADPITPCGCKNTLTSTTADSNVRLGVQEPSMICDDGKTNPHDVLLGCYNGFAANSPRK